MLAPPPVPANAEQVLDQLKAAAAKGDWGRVFDLLDRDSRWSLISLHKARVEACGLVRANYPKARRARALERCAEAAHHKDARAHFIAGGERLPPLGDLAGAKVQNLTFCQTGGLWGFCGLREQYRQLKVKAARDLAVVRESAEAFSRGQ